MKLTVYKNEGSYCIAYEDMSRIILEDIGSQRDANIILKAINDGVFSINKTGDADQIKRMFKALEEIEMEALQNSHNNRSFRMIENAAKRGLGK
jgi:hypothetical protein